ncbi:MAG TPA: hypothetical protein VJ761_04130 [Ktedonobacteraceae bacterium]|nr:hypothetical protein [Ktedonobacteraceae bacterium]
MKNLVGHLEATPPWGAINLAPTGPILASLDGLSLALYKKGTYGFIP